MKCKTVYGCLTPQLCGHARECIEGPSERASPEPAGTVPVVAAVSTGSLPVSSAEYIIQKWAEHRNFAAHEKQRAPKGSLERRAWKERQNLITDMLYDMGRLAGLPIFRQPEENVGSQPRGQNADKLTP